MDINSTLKLTGTLLDGGTTAEAQIAYLRKNKKEICKAVAPHCHESKKAVFELIKPKITVIGRWRRETDKALRDIIGAAMDKKKAKGNPGTVRTSGRRPKPSEPLSPSVNAAQNLTSAAPAVKRNEEPFIPPPTPTLQTAPVAAATQAPRPANTSRPFITTTVRDLSLPEAIKTVLLSYLQSEERGTLLLKYASVQADWRLVPMPADVYAAMEWVDAQLS